MMINNPTRLGSKVDAALAYAAQRIAVFPCWGTDTNGVCACPEGATCPSPGKHPIGELVPNGFKNATTDPETIKRWWERYPNANIGAPTGAVNGFDVLDVDPRSGGDQSWVTLKAQHPELREVRAPFVITPSGGVHLYFRHADGVRNSTSKVAPGIDVRGDGGYVLLPPSTIHGRAYRWGEA